MNKKIKIFYVVDLIIMIMSIIGMLIINNKNAYGLEALTNVGYIVILLFIFITSLMLLVIVSFIYVILRKGRNKEVNKKL